ncbi:polysaccharide pyruvyl transferase family protein [Methylicorpusculum oleiharenae]|uniref:polysaccharide pyruvyl transferase family protein n=1 Tax=Methylicorpusculum oleiharenae TaxID=1338687 RepID=UPI00135C3144|nr:polysaccharide pyruvyl transferase family protein [Methylicorpusculum oleiharenae]MCD2448855.1 polysaccharide pyruvyl transferase family protein [Methylicorpusculum oleiharenae]
MRIAILTQPLHNNYGGLLQAYALQTVVKRMGHEVLTVDIWTVESKRDFKFYFRLFRSIGKRLILRYILGKLIVVNIWPTAKFKNIISQHTQRFINENIQTTSKIESGSNLSTISSYDFEAYIVGSDQVWRPKYSPCLTHYFLDFINENDPAKRIAYAASFGVDNWEYTQEQTIICANLAKRFNAISVREDSAIELCKKHFDVNATHVLDPTLLLNKEDYITLVEKDNVLPVKESLVIYIFDLSPSNKSIITKVSEIYGLNPFFINKNTNTSQLPYNDRIYPPVTQWLRGFMDAEFIITDSFHGTAFSILFNKPFLALGNESRGSARFNSLLKIFGLENRLINSLQELTDEQIKESINWVHVNKVLNERKAEAVRFLKDAIEKV